MHCLPIYILFYSPISTAGPSYDRLDIEGIPQRGRLVEISKARAAVITGYVTYQERDGRRGRGGDGDGGRLAAAHLDYRRRPSRAMITVHSSSVSPHNSRPGYTIHCLQGRSGGWWRPRLARRRPTVTPGCRAT